MADKKKIQIRLSQSAATAASFEWLGNLIKSAVILLLMMTFVFRIAKVDGHSMETTLVDTDLVIATDLFYTPHNGDIVMISRGEHLNRPLVKRVIAIAGQELRIDYAHNAVYVDGVLLDEPYIRGATIQGDKTASEVNGVIPEGKVFVMGDNREHSSDSRFYNVGLIDVDSIIGKVQLDILPHRYEDGKQQLDLSGIRTLYNDEEEK